MTCAFRLANPRLLYYYRISQRDRTMVRCIWYANRVLAIWEGGWGKAAQRNKQVVCRYKRFLGRRRVKCPLKIRIRADSRVGEKRQEHFVDQLSSR